jgi:hypothetical protein
VLLFKDFCFRHEKTEPTARQNGIVRTARNTFDAESPTAEQTFGGRIATAVAEGLDRNSGHPTLRRDRGTGEPVD